MAPKAKRVPVASRSERFVEVMASLTEQAAAAKRNLKEVRKAQKIEKQRRARVIQQASKLNASELMEIAGLKKITLAELSDLVQEMHVPRDEIERAEHLRRAPPRRTRRTSSSSTAPPSEEVVAEPLEVEHPPQSVLPLLDDAPTDAYEADH